MHPLTHFRSVNSASTALIWLVRSLAFGLLLPLALLGLTACGSSGGGDGLPAGPSVTSCGGAFGPCGGGTGPAITIQGRILYERLIASAAGLGPGTETRPARYIDVEVRSAGGSTCFGRASTDANGDYALIVTPDAGTELAYSWSGAGVVTIEGTLPPDTAISCCAGGAPLPSNTSAFLIRMSQLVSAI